MADRKSRKLERRRFLQMAGAAAIGAVKPALARASSSRSVAIILDPSESVTAGEPVHKAVERLACSLRQSGVSVKVGNTHADARNAQFAVLIGPPASPLASSFSPLTVSLEAESLRIAPGKIGSTPSVWVTGIDTRGLVYGVLELADRVEFGGGWAALHLTAAHEEAPLNRVRSIARSYVSDIEDKPWFYDRTFWPAYLHMLVASRFNRFSLTFGLNYDYPKGVTEDYFHFLYPYLLDVPGYNVRIVPELADRERQRNLKTLQFIARETVKRGLQFHVGLWSHGYEWIDSPHAQHTIEGLTPATHPLYCRDALALLLKLCPEISGVTFRIHGESGIPAGEYNFWDVLFSAVRDCGRTVEVDLHAKSLKQPLLDSAVATRQPLKVSPKFAAEHVALGYHQAAIRDLEMPKQYTINRSGHFDLGNNVRGFLRYGYGDLIQQDRPYELLFRVWPGTQRHLLWGDPVLAAGWSRAAGFCGGVGMEFFEPLAFKGREGSGVAGGRNAYADTSLDPKGGDWRKFEYTYRILGRSLYNPTTPNEVWQRYLRRDFGPAAGQVQTALSHAGRLLPTVVNAYLPSAANQWYWPEVYTHLQIVPGGPAPYYDTPSPICFGTADPLDPQLFSNSAEHAAALLEGSASGKYTGLEVAEWLEYSAAISGNALISARKLCSSPQSPAFRRMEEDVLIQSSLGRFFAAKLRSGLFYEIFRQSGDPNAGKLSLSQLTLARDTWHALAVRARGVYRLNIAYGDKDDRRGHWIDRLPAIERDLSLMQMQIAQLQIRSGPRRDASAAIDTAVAPQHRSSIACTHRPPPAFTADHELPLLLDVQSVEPWQRPTAVTLFYRHVNQAEHWQSVPMHLAEAHFVASIPADYTESPFPLQYYFRLRRSLSAWLYPALGPDFAHQPYFLVQASRSI